MRIIPAIDLINGECVRLSQGDYSTRKIYNKNPLEIAKKFEYYGSKYLHLVDLDGAKSSRLVNLKILEKIATHTNLHIEFGGGIRSNQDIQCAFNAGATQLIGGSIAIKNPTLFLKWIKKYGNEKIILAADCNNKKIVTHGWINTSEVDVINFISNFKKHGIIHVICTDISKDGMLKGTSNKLYKEIINSIIDIQLIASGGVRTIKDLEILKQIGCKGVIIGKAIYEKKISLKQLFQFSN